MGIAVTPTTIITYLAVRDIDFPVDWQDGELDWDGHGRPVAVIQAVLSEGNKPKSFQHSGIRSLEFT